MARWRRAGNKEGQREEKRGRRFEGTMGAGWGARERGDTWVVPRDIISKPMLLIFPSFKKTSAAVDGNKLKVEL